MTTENPVPFRRSRGMHDLLPQDMLSFRRIEDAFRGAARHWGYEEVRTPTLETYSLFTVAGGLTPDALSRVYTFLDWDGWSGERLVVRPDSTIPVARAAAEAGLALPARLFYVQNRFLFSGGDEAEHWQCGVELLDAPATLGEVEIAAVACETLEAIGLRPAVRLSQVAVAGALWNGSGEGQASDSRLDPLREAAARAAPGSGLCRNLVTIAEACAPALVPDLRDLTAVAAALDESGRPVTVDLHMPVDFEYYSGVVMELEHDGQPVGAGGRYTPGWSGLTHTACGCALPIAQAAALVSPGSVDPPPIDVSPEGSEQLPAAMGVAKELHRAGFAASLGSPRPGALAVLVRAAGMTAALPDGERQVATVSELIPLLRGSE